jgi:hypothetical protein
MVVGSLTARAIRRHRSASALSSVDVSIWVSPHLSRTPPSAPKSYRGKVRAVCSKQHTGASPAPCPSPMAGRLRYRCFEFVVLINRVPVLAGKNAERVRHYSGAGITDQNRSQAVDNLRK